MLEDLLNIITNYLKKTQNYFLQCYGQSDRTPFIEELAIELGVDEDTVVEWRNKKKDDGRLAFPEFSATYDRIYLLQKLRLKQAGLKGKSQSFITFLLSANHGVIASDRQIFSGDKKEPLEIIITEAETEA